MSQPSFSMTGFSGKVEFVGDLDFFEDLILEIKLTRLFGLDVGFQLESFKHPIFSNFGFDVEFIIGDFSVFSFTFFLRMPYRVQQNEHQQE